MTKKRYSSKKLQRAEKNYTTTEKECLAVVWGIQKIIEYLEGIPFTVITYHIALKWSWTMVDYSKIVASEIVRAKTRLCANKPEAKGSGREQLCLGWTLRYPETINRSNELLRG